MDKAIGWSSSEEIGGTIGCSYKTIQTEIKIIESLLPESWELLSKKGYGMKLIHPPEETVDSIFVHDDNELIFQLINILINKKENSIERIGELLYINRNMTFQLLKQVRNKIKPFHLTLKSRPYQIEGNEGSIRLLLFEIRYAQNGSELKKYIKLYSEVLVYLKEIHGLTLSGSGISTFFSFLNICISRIREGFNVDLGNLPFDINESRINQGYYKEFNGFFIVLEEILECELQSAERLCIFLGLIYSEWDYIQSLEEALVKYPQSSIFKALEMVITDEDCKNLYVPRNEYKEFCKFIYFIEENLGMDFCNDRYFINTAFNLYCITKVRAVCEGFDHVSLTELLVKELINEYPSFFLQIQWICKKFGCENNFIFNKVTISAFTVLILEYMRLNKKLKPNVVFVTSRSRVISDFTLNKMKRHFGGNSKWNKMIFGEVYESDPLFENVDLIVTDTELTEFSKNILILLIKNNLSNKELLEIEFAIDLCTKRKYKIFFELLPQLS